MNQRKTSTAENALPIPLDLVGCNSFGRYDQISLAQTFNMLMVVKKEEDGSDKKSLIPFAGYNWKLALGSNGRALVSSVKAGLMFAVSDDTAYKIGPSLTPSRIGTLGTNSGDVFVDEDILGNMAFCDGSNIYIYNYNTGLFYTAGDIYYIGNLSQSSNMITGVGTAFTSAMVGGTIYFSDSTTALITAFSDGTHLIVNTSATKSSQPVFIRYALDFTPNYIFFHDARFIAMSGYTNGVQVGQWRLSQARLAPNGVTYIGFPAGAVLAQFQGTFQTKADLPIGGFRFPGRANLIMIMGSILTEPWTDTATALFPYTRNTTYNLDYGTLNPATIATLGTIAVWLGANERSGPVIMYTTGQDVIPISDDGINYRLARIKFPKSSYGLAFKQDGKLIYILTFYEQVDNVTFAYDFSVGKFVTLTDEQMNYFIAKHAVYFNNTYYINSINDGSIYELSSDFTDYIYQNNLPETIPRVRVCSTFRTTDSIPKVLNNIIITIEQGIDKLNLGQFSNISTIGIVENGYGYTTAEVIITGDGTGAYATATVVDGAIFSIDLVSTGVNYSWAVATIAGDGIGAQLETTLTVDPYIPRIDLSMSYNGGYLFGSSIGQNMNVCGDYHDRLVFNELGYSNEFTPQFRFTGLDRFVVTDAEMNFYE